MGFIRTPPFQSEILCYHPSEISFIPFWGLLRLYKSPGNLLSIHKSQVDSLVRMHTHSSTELFIRTDAVSFSCQKLRALQVAELDEIELVFLPTWIPSLTDLIYLCTSACVHAPPRVYVTHHIFILPSPYLPVHLSNHSCNPLCSSVYCAKWLGLVMPCINSAAVGLDDIFILFSIVQFHVFYTSQFTILSKTEYVVVWPVRGERSLLRTPFDFT